MKQVISSFGSWGGFRTQAAGKAEVARGWQHAIAAIMVALSLVATGLAAGLTFGKDVALADAYTYTVTVNAGREGVLNPNGIAVPAHATISGDEQHLKITGLNYGDRISFLGNIATTAADSDYYVRGVRYGGRDGNTSLAELSFEVVEDRDYVVAFARANDLVPYTVQYVSAEGEPLYEEQIYYGNVGDKPVVACLYFDGYQPRAYNITKTLDADPAQNVLTFVYDPIVLPDPVVDEGGDGEEGPGPEQPEPPAPTPANPDDPNTAPEPSGDGSDDQGANALNPSGEGDLNAADSDNEGAGDTATSGDGVSVPVLSTNNGGGSPAPSAATAIPAVDTANGNTGATGVEGASGVIGAPQEETIDDNANPLGVQQLADLDEIEDDANPLALFGSAIPSAGNQSLWMNPWILGLSCAAVVLLVILAAWLIYDRRSRRAFAESGYAAPTDVSTSLDEEK